MNEIRGFRRHLRALEREVELSLISQTECCGVTVAQCHLLLEVGERSEGSIGEFAGALELDTSTLSRTVDGLVRNGFLSRQTDPGNRRKQIIRLNPSGKDKVEEVNRLCDDYYAGLLEAIPERKRSEVVESVLLLAEAMKRWRKEEAPSCCPGQKAAAMEEVDGTASS